MKHVLLIGALLVSAASAAQQLRVSGYWRTMPSWTDIAFLEADPMSQAYLHQRTNVRYKHGAFTVRLEARTRLFYGSQVERTAGFAEGVAADGGLWDGSWNWWESADGRGVGNTLIDRALVSYRNGVWRVDVGRQRINWGRHTVWNPNDLFNAYNFFDFDYAERPGTDAVRVRRLVGSNGMNELEVAARPGSGDRAPLVAGLFRFNLKEVDGQILAAYIEEAFAAGAAGSVGIGAFAIKGEATAFGASPAWGDSAIWSGTLGVEATWGQGNFAQVAVLRTPGLGGLALMNTATQTQQPWALLPFGLTTMAQLQVPIGPRFRFGAALLYAPEDRALIGMPTLTWDAARNLTASVVVQHLSMPSPFVPDGAMEPLTTAVFGSLQWNFRKQWRR